MIAGLWLALVGCHHPAPETPAETHPVQLTIVAMNDFHGALYERANTDAPGKARGGLPWLVGAVDLLRSEDPELLLLDGGDSFQGDYPVNASEGRGSVAAFELLKVDATAIGNHEFDYGQGMPETDALRGALMTQLNARSQWVSANIFTKDAAGLPVRWTPAGLEPYRILERRGVKIGVIGLTTTETPQTTLLKNVADLMFQDPVETVRELVPEVKAKGAQVIVVVGHLTGQCHPKSFEDAGDPCVPDGEIGRLLSELPPGTIDVLVVGHAHTLLNERIGDTFVMEDRSHGQVLTQLDLVVGADGPIPDASTLHAPWTLNHDAADPGCADTPYPPEPRDLGGRMVAPSQAAAHLIEDLEKETDDLCGELACADVPLTRNRDGESELGDITADAMFAAFPDADFAVTNSGGLRADLPKGMIRESNVYGAMPFDNQTVLVEMTGAQVRELFRIGGSGAHGVLQVSHAMYRFDSTQTASTDRNGDGKAEDWERDRLCHVFVQGKPLDEAKTYKVVTSDFLYGGGDHLTTAFSGTKILKEGPLLRDTLQSTLDALNTCWTSPIDPKHRRVETGPCR